MVGRCPCGGFVVQEPGRIVCRNCGRQLEEPSTDPAERALASKIAGQLRCRSVEGQAVAPKSWGPAKIYEDKLLNRRRG